MIFYKIRKKDTNLYVKGTPAYHDYNKSGRVFQTLGMLRMFVHAVIQHKQWNHNESPSDWEIVELETVERSTKTVYEIVSEKKLIEML